MKLLGVAQGNFLRVFWQISQRLGLPGNQAIYVSDAGSYARLAADIPELAQVPTLKEWEITTEARAVKPDMARLKALQAELPSSLWHAILADRRVIFGKHCKVRQDYRSRYNEEQMLSILDVATHQIGVFLDEQKPDMVIGFGSTTFGDYLFEVLARLRSIPYVQFKATKIDNNVALFETGISAPDEIVAAFDAMRTMPVALKEKSIVYLKQVRERGIWYEGTILFGRDRMLRRLSAAPRALASGLISDLRRRRDPVLRDDPHIPLALPSAWYNQVVHPLRTVMIGRRLPILSPRDVDQLTNFAFFPMHFEPEVALQVFGRSYQNQIEVVRMLALSLPVGMPLLVKEHPRSLGFRKESYYRKLLEIPNVRLVDPFMPAIDIVRRSSLACVITGSIGLEAAIVGKPVLMLGETSYTLLPDRMVQQARDPNRLDRQIRDLLERYEMDEMALIRYVASILSLSEPVNLYTELLQKAERYSSAASRQSADEAYDRLAGLVRSRLQGLC